MQGILTIREVVNQHPTHYQANLELGKFSLQTGQFEKALQRLEQASQSRTNEWEPWFYLGMTYEQLGQLPQAHTAYDNALSRTTNEQFRQLIVSHKNAL